VDAPGTVDARRKTATAQTVVAQPTAISAPPTDRPTLVPESVVQDTMTPIADLTTTPATAAGGPGDSISTATLAAIPGRSIPTLTIRTYETLPPAVASSDITLINKSSSQAYISLRGTSHEGKYAVIEYPVVERMEIKAPIGSCLCAAWLGGKRMAGNLSLHGNEELSITLSRDKVDVH